MILEFYKTRDDVVTPTRANPSDAGLDLYFCPDNPTLEGQWLESGESGLFQTGLKFGVPHGYMLEVKNRSGNAAKRHLLVGACVIDSGYDGEVFVNLHNVGHDRQLIEKNMKIAQVVLTPVVHFRPQLVPEDVLYAEPITISDRGDGSLGSTDG
jgi:dUTP pyrophosphatase